MCTSRLSRSLMVIMFVCSVGIWNSQAMARQAAPAPLDPKGTNRPPEDPGDGQGGSGGATPAIPHPPPPPEKPKNPPTPPTPPEWPCEALTHTLVVSKQTTDDDDTSLNAYPATVFRNSGDSASGSCWLVTSLDALRFETGRRSVEIWFVGPTPNDKAGASRKSTIEKVSSYRFIWSEAVSSIALLELTPEESRIAQNAGAALSWAETPAAEPGTPTKLRVAWVESPETIGKPPRKAVPRCATTMAAASNGRSAVEIEPNQPAALLGAPFLTSEGTAPRLAGIGFDVGAPYQPSEVTGILLKAGIEEIRDAGRKVEDLQMLERELPRWGNPKGYEGLVAFAARKGCPNFLSWRVGVMSGSTYVDTYRPSTALGNGMRILGVVCEDQNVDATIELNRPENKGSGREQHPALDAALGVRSASESAGAKRTTSVSPVLPGPSRLLFLETVADGSDSRPMPKPR